MYFYRLIKITPTLKLERFIKNYYQIKGDSGMCEEYGKKIENINSN